MEAVVGCDGVLVDDFDSGDDRNSLDEGILVDGGFQSVKIVQDTAVDFLAMLSRAASAVRMVVRLLSRIAASALFLLHV